MNNDNKIVDQALPQTPVAPIAPAAFDAAPVGIANKEMGPVSSNVSEFVRPAGPEISPNLTPEVAKSGVKVPTDKPELTSAQEKFGLGHAGSDVPVPSGPTGLVKIPQTTDINSSGTWLNALTEKIQKVMRLMGV